jgi:hypothetical protein
VPESAPATEAQSMLTISNWKPVQINTLVACFTITTMSGLVIHQCSLHRRNGQRWLGLPTQRRGDEYVPLVEFTTRKVAENFRRQVMNALEAEGRG